jgi:hypothetical protein
MDTAEIEPLLRASATVEIDTRTPLADVVDQLAVLAGPPSSRDPLASARASRD